MRKFKYLLLLFIAFQWVNAFGYGQPKIHVKTEKIGYFDFHNQFTGVGKCEFATSKNYYAKVVGSVDNVLIEQGQDVSKDKVVLTIDQELADATLAAAEAGYRLAEENYNRDLSLLKKRVISEEALNKSKAAFEQSRLDLAKARIQFADMVIKAPFDGSIGVVKAKARDNVKVGDYLFSVIAAGEKIIFVELPENLLGKINHEAIISATDVDNKLAKGKILAIANYVSNNGTVTLKASFPEEAKLNHGSFTEVSLLYSQHKGLAVPEKAILKNDKGNFVYKISAESTTKQTYISLGARTGEMVELTGGELGENDLIVTEGLTKVQDDTQVELTNE